MPLPALPYAITDWEFWGQKYEATLLVSAQLALSNSLPHRVHPHQISQKALFLEVWKLELLVPEKLEDFPQRVLNLLMVESSGQWLEDRSQKPFQLLFPDLFGFNGSFSLLVLATSRSKCIVATSSPHKRNIFCVPFKCKRLSLQKWM